MSSLKYIGPASVSGTDIVTRKQTIDLLNAADPNRSSASGVVAAAAAIYASKTYVDNQDATFESPYYYQTQDSLNVLISAKGQPNGVAELDVNSKIPASRFPALGTGYMLGPWGPTARFTATTSNTPAKIADWNIGVQGLSFVPQVFCTIFATCAEWGCPVIELRMSDGAQPYDDQTLIGFGKGRTLYWDAQPITVTTAPPAVGQTGSNAWPSSTNIWVSAWLYDLNSQTSTVTDDDIVSGGVFLERTAL